MNTNTRHLIRDAIARDDFARYTAATGLLYSHLIYMLGSGPKRLTIEQLADLTHISRRTLYRSMKTLCNGKRITVTPSRAEHRHMFDGTYELCQFVSP